MNAKIKWDDRQGLPGFGWLGTPLGQSMAERQRIASLTPFAFAAPLVQRRSKVQWLGEIGVGVAIKDTPGYKACLGKLIQNCGQWKDANGTPLWQLPGWPTLADNPGAKAVLDICLGNAEATCLLQAGAETGVVLTPDQIKARQAQINALLKKYDYCLIGEDGKLGGETCGAAVWAAGVDPSIAVPAACANIKSNFQLKNCPAGGGGGGPAFDPCKGCTSTEDCVDKKCVPKCPAGQSRGTDGLCKVAAKPTSSETPWGLFVLGAAALGAIGLVFLKAPKLPPREADVARDNPRRRRAA